MSVDLNKLPEEARNYRQGLLKLKENLDNAINGASDRFSNVYLITLAMQKLTDEMLFGGDAMSAMDQERQEHSELPLRERDCSNCYYGQGVYCDAQNQGHCDSQGMSKWKGVKVKETSGWVNVDTPPKEPIEVLINGQAKTGHWNGELWQSQYGLEHPTLWAFIPKPPQDKEKGC